MAIFRYPLGRAAQRRGFTLVEIMLVVVILSVMAGAVVANMSAGYARIAVKSQAELLCDTIAAAQHYSQARGLICRLNIDTARGQFWVEQSPAPDRPFVQAEGELGRTVTLPSGTRFVRMRHLSRQTGSDNRIRFFPDGASEPAWIWLAASSGEERIVRIGTYGGCSTIEESRR